MQRYRHLSTKSNNQCPQLKPNQAHGAYLVLHAYLQSSPIGMLLGLVVEPSSIVLREALRTLLENPSTVALLELDQTKHGSRTIFTPTSADLRNLRVSLHSNERQSYACLKCFEDWLDLKS